MYNFIHNFLYKLKRLILFLSLLTYFTSYSQNSFTLSGYVTEEETGESLIGVSVFDEKSLKGTTTKVPTGLAVSIPPGYEGQIRARSSLGAKGIILPNGIGTIDADYRGQIHVLMTWIGEGDSTIIDAGERIAQMVISEVPKVSFLEVKSDELGSTERGDGGFGSTGRH